VILYSVQCHALHWTDKKVTINDASPLEAAVITKLKSFWGFELSCRQTQLAAFHLDSPWGATLMPLRVCAMDYGNETEY